MYIHFTYWILAFIAIASISAISIEPALVFAQANSETQDNKQQKQISVTTDSKLYAKGETITISGTLKEPVSLTLVKIDVYNSTGQVIYETSASADKQFSTLIYINDFPAGEYQIAATYHGHSARTSFNIIEEGITVDSGGNVTSDNQTAFLSDSFNMSGNNFSQVQTENDDKNTRIDDTITTPRFTTRESQPSTISQIPSSNQSTFLDADNTTNIINDNDTNVSQSDISSEPDAKITFSANGTINSLTNLDEDSNNASDVIILTGDWTMEVNQGTITDFNTNIVSISNNATNLHTHQLLNFENDTNNNGIIQLDPDNSITIFGNVDVGSNDQINWHNVPVAITIKEGKTITIKLDDIATDSHFVDQPIYGLVESIEVCSIKPVANMAFEEQCQIQ